MRDYLQERRQQVESHLRQALQPRPGLPPSLLEAMRYSLLAPGKRLRPLLVLLASEALSEYSGKVNQGEQKEGAHRQQGKDTINPWPAACAVEMIHAYSLIHDDLPAMDDDDLRRGQPTCHKKYGESLAILAGDALQAMAFEVLAASYPGTLAARACKELAQAAGGAGMVGGQVDDLAWEREGNPGDVRDVEALERIHARKTGALIRASLRLGVLVTASEPAVIGDLLPRFDSYGRCLGLAFQIVDDLLDVEGQAEQTGKRVQKDAERGKLTYPGLLGVAESRRRARELGEEAREALKPLGTSADRLLQLIEYVLERDR